MTDEDLDTHDMLDTSIDGDAVSVLSVRVRQSLYIDAFYGYHPARITIDSGATGNMIRASFIKGLGAEI